MRIGINPTRKKVSSYRPARVTVAVIVFIPNQSGYFRHRFDLLKLCLGSILKHTFVPFDLLVFDNGSCTKVVDYLKTRLENNDIQYLVLSSQNIGKIGALQLIHRAAPGDIVAYCDDDIFFYPDWLSAHLQVLEAFPRVGMVSGWAIRHTFNYGNKSCINLAETNPNIRIERTRSIPEEWEVDFAISTGRDPQQYLEATKDMQDIVLHFDGVSAYATADHFQFVSPKSILHGALPDTWSGQLMGQMIEIDEAIDAAGYLRLSTVERCVRHMGNVLSPDLHEEAGNFGFDLPLISNSKPRNLIRRLVRTRPISSMMRSAYDRLYWILND